jgi:hypothetical protein
MRPSQRRFYSQRNFKAAGKVFPIEVIKQEELMKTGQDASRSGLYVSECCGATVALVKDDMFPRCPRCFSLTLWEFIKPRLRISS